MNLESVNNKYLIIKVFLLELQFTEARKYLEYLILNIYFERKTSIIIYKNIILLYTCIIKCATS